MVQDWDRFSSPDFMGQLTIPLFEIFNLAGEEKWFPLQTNQNNETVSGDILLRFTLLGFEEDEKKVEGEKPL